MEEAAAKEGGRGGRRGARQQHQHKNKKQVKNDKALLTMILKAVLQLQQEARTLSGAIYNVFTVKTDSSESKAMKEQGVAYSEMAKDNPQHESGPPHTYQLMAMIVALRDRGESTGARNQSMLKDIAEKYTNMNLDERADAVRVCRLARA